LQLSWNFIVFFIKLSWTKNILEQTKYVTCASESKMKAENDLLKFNTARELHNHEQQIRENYHEDMISSKMKIRQRAVALYFIDRVCSVLGHCSVSKVALHDWYNKHTSTNS